jgi:cell division protein FtsL
MYSLFLYIFALLHVLGAICTHHQERKLQSTALTVLKV